MFEPECVEMSHINDIGDRIVFKKYDAKTERTGKFMSYKYIELETRREFLLRVIEDAKEQKKQHGLTNVRLIDIRYCDERPDPSNHIWKMYI